jgi:hypothetical protein
MSIILGDMTEHLGSAIQNWNLAASAIRGDPDRALTLLVETEIDLDIFVRTGVAEALRATRAATARLDRELPDEGSVPASTRDS